MADFKSDLDSFEYEPYDPITHVNVTRPRVPAWPLKNDKVNSPSHYTRGRTEAIDVIEDAIIDAPTAVEGLLQAQALKYLLRLWLKDNPEEDAKKARWYLNRLINKLTD